MMSVYWLSFVDEDKPAGSRFLGVCCVEADNANDAIVAAWDAGCNPGGEVAIHKIKDVPGGIPMLRLMGKDEAKKWADKL